MINQDDWTTFCAMMAAAQYTDLGLVQDKQGITTGRVWQHENGKSIHIPLGDWREWLKAGQTPPVEGVG